MTISPGTLASGVAPPSTAHSISRPWDIASTMTSESCSKALATAAGSSAASMTLTMPTDDPARAGLTNTGSPSVSAAGSNGSPARRAR